MSLEDTIMSDLKVAMKKKDQASLRTIRAIKAALLLKKTERHPVEITPEVEIKLLQKMTKQRQESLDIYQKQNRADLARKEMEEIEIIKKYLPDQLKPDELKRLLQEVILETGATRMKDMGKVMELANKKLAGKAENTLIAGIVKSLLSN